MTKPVDLLPNPSLRRLLAAQVPADFADWLDFVAIGALLAYVWNAPPFVFALLAVSLGLPYLLIGPFAGVLVDRADIKRIMILSNVGRGIVTVAFFFAPNWIVLMVLVALRSTVGTFFTPAKQAAIQALTEPDERMRANGLSHAINQASKIVAPAAGGSLLIWLAPQQVFLLNALVSCVAAALLLRLSAVPRPALQATDGNMLQNLRDGLGEVGGNGILRAALMMMAAGYFAMFFYDTLIAPLTRDLGFSQTVLGLSLAAVGGGGVVGSLALGTTNRATRPFAWIAVGSLIAAFLVIALGWFEVAGIGVTTASYMVIFAALGLCSAMAVVPFRTILQSHAPPDRIGRITALSEALNTLALLTAPFIGAAIASFASVGASFITGGIVMLMVAVRAWSLRNSA